VISTFPRNPQRDYCYDFQPGSSHPRWTIFGEQVALARADQSLGHYDASVRAHVDRRFPPGDRPSGCLLSQYRQKPLRVEVLDAKRQNH
jgi:hypothetical protein